MNGAEVARMYEISYGAIIRNLEDVSNEESLARPEVGGNSLNWVLGHIVVYRCTVLKLVGCRPVFEGEQTKPYLRGSHPDGSEQYVDLATLHGLLSDAQQELIPALSIMTEDQLAKDVPAEFNRPPLAGSLGNALMRMNFHESYHAGQIGILRRFAGREGAIR